MSKTIEDRILAAANEIWNRPNRQYTHSCLGEILHKHFDDDLAPRLLPEEVEAAALDIYGEFLKSNERLTSLDLVRHVVARYATHPATEKGEDWKAKYEEANAELEACRQECNSLYAAANEPASKRAERTILHLSHLLTKAEHGKA